MSYSAKRKNKTLSLKNLDKENEEKKKKKINTPQRYSPLNIYINNMNLTITPNSHDSISTENTNTSFFKEKEFAYNNIPIIHMNEENFENYFIPKRKKIFKPPTIINNKKIFFKDKKIKLF